MAFARIPLRYHAAAHKAPISHRKLTFPVGYRGLNIGGAKYYNCKLYCEAEDLDNTVI